MTPADGRRRWSWSMWVAAAVLVAALALQGVEVFRRPAPPRGPHLAQVVPAAAAGWSVRDVPLGRTEFLADEAAKVLNFDEFLNREYTRGRVTVGVYVAYWSADRMPTRLVASHTPDRCWTENGWTCREMKFRQAWTFGGAELPPAEWRLFDPPGGAAPTHVLYWHLVSGQVYDYGARFNAVPHPWLWWKDALGQVFHGNREQYFIRLTSSVPFETIRDDPGVVEIVRGLARLGRAGQTASAQAP